MSADPPTPLTYRGKYVVRILGAVFLSASAVMLVLGLTVLSEQLRGLRFMLYWSWCFVITVVAILVALWDMLMIRRASRQTRRKLIEEQLLRQPPAGKD